MIKFEYNKKKTFFFLKFFLKFKQNSKFYLIFSLKRLFMIKFEYIKKKMFIYDEFIRKKMVFLKFFSQIHTNSKFYNYRNEITKKIFF